MSYTCNDPDHVLIWSSPIIAGDFTITYLSSETAPTLTVNGVNAMETHTNASTCINSTLTFTGHNLKALNGVVLNCRFTTTDTMINISIPREYCSLFIVYISRMCVL